MGPDCPICAGKSAPHYAAGAHRMYQCGKCHTAFVHPMPSDDWLREYYSTYHAQLGEGGGYELVEDRMASDFGAKAELARRACAGRTRTRVLDVGCGKGYFVRACCDAGLNAEGIDLSDRGVAHAVNELGVKATCGRIEDFADKWNGAFDVVTFWATIEHLRDPIGALRAMRRVIRPGGTLLLDTGIGHDWLDRLLPGCVQWYDPPQHLFVFSQEGLGIALRKAGFRNVSIDPMWERSPARKALRAVRGFVVGVEFRTVAALCRLRHGPFQYTRFPLGNLMSASARAPRR